MAGGEKDEAIAELWAEGRDHHEIAAAVGRNPQSVTRALTRLGLRDMRQPLIVDRDRAQRLAEEGMPATWIAEDIGVSRDAALRIASAVPNHRENVLEWRRAWAGIRHRPALRELHAEITPRIT